MAALRPVVTGPAMYLPISATVNGLHTGFAAAEPFRVACQRVGGFFKRRVVPARSYFHTRITRSHNRPRIAYRSWVRHSQFEPTSRSSGLVDIYRHEHLAGNNLKGPFRTPLSSAHSRRPTPAPFTSGRVRNHRGHGVVALQSLADLLRVVAGRTGVRLDHHPPAHLRSASG